jgi:uncharacterized protein
MERPFSQPGPVDLEALDEYLSSDRSPPDCMDLSQLDGFLAGVAVGPEPVLPSEFLPVVWGGEEPEFADMGEARSLVGSILGRYNEIIETLDDEPSSYSPLFWQDATGNRITEDWAVGFMQAVALRPEAWEPVLSDDETAMMLIPIGIIAGQAEPEVGLQDVTLPDAFIDSLQDRSEELFPACVLGLRSFWADHARAANPPPGQRPH